MKTVRTHIDLPDDVRAILRRLDEHGHEAFVVGGAVRDHLLGRAPNDFDLATSAHPKTLERLFGRRAVGNAFGVFLVDGHEVAPYRTDLYDLSGAAKNVRISLAKSLADDVARRDFTVNGLAYRHGIVVDHVGGLADLDAGLVRFIGEPAHRIQEDSVRMVRGIRFSARLGFRVHEDSLQAIRMHSHRLKAVPGERIRAELLKILACPEIMAALALLDRCGVFRAVLPELHEGHAFEQNRHHRETVLEHNLLAAAAVRKTDPILRLAMLLHDVGKPARAGYDPDKGDRTFHGHEVEGERMARRALRRLRFSNGETERIAGIVRNHMFRLDVEPSDKSVKRFMQHPGYRDLLRARLADRKGNLAKAGRGIPASFLNLVRAIRRIERERPPMTLRDVAVDGNDLIAMGLVPGPAFGRILHGLLDHVLEFPESNTRDELLPLARELARPCPERD